MAPGHPLASGQLWRRVEPLTGDASARTYVRLEDRQRRTVILASYPGEANRSLQRDLDVLEWLRRHGLRVPTVVAHDLEAGWMLVEDFGPDDAALTLRRTPAHHRGAMLDRTVAPLQVLAGVPPDELPSWNAPLDRQRLRWELAGFELWFARHWRGMAPAPILARWLDGIAEEIASHPLRVCHRDYHLNNLFFLEPGGVGVIDVQDILVGPDSYDAASLIAERDTPRLVSAQERTRWLEHWAGRTGAAPGWQQRWRRVRLQRALKVLGTFARLTLAGRSGYRCWLERLARDLIDESDTLGLPPQLIDLLLD